MILFIWLYLAILVAYFLIRSIVHQHKIKEREKAVFKMFEVQENKMLSDYKMLSKKLHEIEVH